MSAESDQSLVVGVGVSVTPSSARVAPGQLLDFNASVTGTATATTSAEELSRTLKEWGEGGGTIPANGNSGTSEGGAGCAGVGG